MNELPRECDVAVVGGGILGLATAHQLAHRGVAPVVLEAEARLAMHQTGHNSGVIHSGLYYKPGSLKARLCVEGREALYAFCAAHGIAHERCGKLVVALDEDELPRLRELERRGTANGLLGVRRLDADAVREREPAVRCVEGLLVPETGIVDYRGVGETLAHLVRASGGAVVTCARVHRAQRAGGAVRLETARGAVTCRTLVNCAGLRADQVARRCGVTPRVRIVPFRGEYYELAPARRSLIRHLVYPVPDPRFPFLGVHFTRRIDGGVEAGPNAVLALAREGYRKANVSPGDVLQMLGYAGFWRMARRYWRTGLAESHRSWSRRAFVSALARMVPALRPGDVHPAGAGVRAQAVDPAGALVDDFCIEHADGMVHVLNAPSPGATASLAIGRVIAELALESLGVAAALGDASPATRQVAPR